MSSAFVSRLTWLIFALVGVFTLVHLFVLGLDEHNVWRMMFDLERERNIPTWFACILWFLAATYAVIIWHSWDAGRQESPRHPTWLVLAGAFTVASMDEVSGFHEAFPRIFCSLCAMCSLNLPAYLANWVVVYAPLLVIYSVVAGTFLWRRFRGQPVCKLLLVMAALCYASAPALEALEHNKHLMRSLRKDEFLVRTRYLWTIEETLENLGTACAVAALSRYASRLARTERALTKRAPTHISVLPVDSADAMAAIRAD